MSRGSRARRRWTTVLVYAAVTPFVLFALFPFYYMVVTSLKGDPELYDLDAIPYWVSQGLTLQHYRFLLGDTLFLRWFWNTVFVSVLTVMVSVTLGILAAYAVARLRFRGVATFGVGIFIIGVVAGRFTERRVLIGAVNRGYRPARLLASMVRGGIVVLATAIALNHVGIGGTIVPAVLLILIGGAALAAALAVGFGSRDFVRRWLEARVNEPEDVNRDEIEHW